MDRFSRPIFVDMDTKDLLDILNEADDKELSTNELYRRLSYKSGGIGRSAFYNRLELAKEQGLIDRYSKRNRVYCKLNISMYIRVISEERQKTEDMQAIEYHVRHVLNFWKPSSNWDSDVRNLY